VSVPGTSGVRPFRQPGDTAIVARFCYLERSRDNLIKLRGVFAGEGIHSKALDLGVDGTTPPGKMVLQICCP